MRWIRFFAVEIASSLRPPKTGSEPARVCIRRCRSAKSGNENRRCSQDVEDGELTTSTDCRERLTLLHDRLHPRVSSGLTRRSL